MGRPGRRAGWDRLAAGAYVAYQSVPTGQRRRELRVGKVMANTRKEQKVTVQPCKGVWSGVKVKHVLQFEGRGGHFDTGGMPAREMIRYEALVLHVELLSDKLRA